MKSGFFVGDWAKGVPVFQYLAMITGTLNIICSGMHYGWPSPSLPQLLHGDSHIPMSKDEGSWIAVMLSVGALVGSIIGGFLLDVIGRKNVILLSSLPFFASWLMLGFAQSVAVLIAGRFMAGISDGLVFCAIPMYLGEIADPKIRGLFGSGISVAFIFGTLVMNVMGSYLSISIAALISSALPLLLLMTFYWMPESPYFLIMKGHSEAARRSLIIFKGSEDIEPELERLTQAVKEQNANTGKVLDLFTVKSNRKALYITMGTRGAQQFSGTTAFTFYAQIIFKEAGDSISPSAGSNIYFGIQLIISGFSSMIVDKAGRRPLMIVSIIGTGLALLSEGCYFYIRNSTTIDTNEFSWVPLVALVVFVVVFSIGMQTIPVLMLGEIFPTNVKAFACSFSDIYTAVITIAISKFFQFSKDEFGIHVPFFFFAGCCGLALLFIACYVPETKGKTLEEIQQELKGERNVKSKMLELPEIFRKLDTV